MLFEEESGDKAMNEISFFISYFIFYLAAVAASNTLYSILIAGKGRTASEHMAFRIF